MFYLKNSFTRSLQFTIFPWDANICIDTPYRHVLGCARRIQTGLSFDHTRAPDPLLGPQKAGQARAHDQDFLIARATLSNC